MTTDRLRALGGGLGAALAALAVWARLTYGPTVSEAALVAGGLAAVLAVGPPAIPRARFALVRYLRAPDATDGTWVASTDRLTSRRRCLEATQTAVESSDADLTLEQTSFTEGPGLTAHAGAQVGFVRVTADSRLVVGGSTVVVSRIRESIDKDGALDVGFRPVDRNPFARPTPIRGAPRVALAVFLVVAAVAGVLIVADGAYGTDAYNPLEKTGLLAIDVRTAVDPTHSAADAALDRAAFMTDILDEEATEIRWTNGTTPAVHAQQAVVVTRDVRANLDRAEDRELTAAQQSRAARIRARSDRARTEVVRAIDDTIRTAPETVDLSRLRASRDALQRETGS